MKSRQDIGLLGAETVKAVMPDVPPDIIEWRKRTGAHQWDEMWEGVLHLPPSPNREHQELEGELETRLRTFWRKPQGAKVYHQINVSPPGCWPDSYRIPDLVLLLPDRFDIDRNEYFEGAPTVVVEIHSPGDEAYEKLSFYASLGVPEAWIIDRDSKEPRVYLLQEDEYRQQAAGEDGWISSKTTGILLRSQPDKKLAIQLAGEAQTRRELPEA